MQPLRDQGNRGNQRGQGFRSASYICWGLFLGWFLLLWYLSGNPFPEIPGPDLFPHADKVMHTGYFFGGGLFLYSALYFSASHPSKRFLAILTIVGIAFVGWLDEYHQSFVPGRSGNDWGDFLADFLGGLLAVIACPLVLGKMAQSKVFGLSKFEGQS